MRNLAALLVCLVAIAVYFGPQKPTVTPKPSPSQTLPAPAESANSQSNWGEWATYKAEDGSFEVSLPGTPGVVTVSQENIQEYSFQANCHRDGEAIKVGWSRHRTTIGDYDSCALLGQQPFQTSVLKGKEYRLHGDAHWSPRLDGIGLNDSFKHHRLILVPTKSRTYFLLLSTTDLKDLKNDFPKLRNSFRIKETR